MTLRCAANLAVIHVRPSSGSETVNLSIPMVTSLRLAFTFQSIFPILSFTCIVVIINDCLHASLFETDLIVFFLQTEKEDGTCELIVKNADRFDGGCYRCVAENIYGSDRTTCEIVVQC